MSNLHNTIEYINSLSQSDPKELIDRSEQRFKILSEMCRIR